MSTSFQKTMEWFSNSIKKTYQTKTRKILLGVWLFAVLYILTAPFIFPPICHTRFGGDFYRPIELSLEKPWFGRNIMWWYCYDICHM